MDFLGVTVWFGIDGARSSVSGAFSSLFSFSFSFSFTSTPSIVIAVGSGGHTGGGWRRPFVMFLSQVGDTDVSLNIACHDAISLNPWVFGSTAMYGPSKSLKPRKINSLVESCLWRVTCFL